MKVKISGKGQLKECFSIGKNEWWIEKTVINSMLITRLTKKRLRTARNLVLADTVFRTI